MIAALLDLLAKRGVEASAVWEDGVLVVLVKGEVEAVDEIGGLFVDALSPDFGEEG